MYYTNKRLIDEAIKRQNEEADSERLSIVFPGIEYPIAKIMLSGLSEEESRKLYRMYGDEAYFIASLLV